jgi:hypothetical protein
MKEIAIESSFLTSRSGAAGKVDFSGRWRNQRGSSIELTVDDRGRLSGTFRTAVGAPLPARPFRCAASRRAT